MKYVIYFLVIGVVYYLYWKKSTQSRSGVSVRPDELANSGADMEALATLERDYGGEVAQAVRQVIQTSDVRGLERMMQRVRESAWDVRYGLMEGGGVLSYATLKNWAASDEQAAAPQLLLAEYLIKEGFRARGYGSGSSVSDQGRRIFREKLAEADQILQRVTALDPADPTAPARLVSLASYQSMPESVARERFNTAISRAPDHFAAMKNMTHYYSPYWNGSKEQALAFGREMSASASEGSLRAGTIITSYVTLWHQMHYFEKGTNEAMVRKYFADANVLAEVRNAYTRSVASVNHRLSQWSYILLNHAAAIFYMAQERALAADALARIGNRSIDNPWEYLGNPAKEFKKACKWAGLA